MDSVSRTCHPDLLSRANSEPRLAVATLVIIDTFHSAA